MFENSNRTYLRSIDRKKQHSLGNRSQIKFKIYKKTDNHAK